MRGGELSEYKAFSPDLSAGVVEPEGSTPLSPLASERTPYLREEDGRYVPLVNPANVPEGTEFGGESTTGVHFVGASADLSHVLLSSPQPLTEGFQTSGHRALYEYSGGELQPVSSVSTGKEGGAQAGSTTTSSGTRCQRMVGACSSNRLSVTYSCTTCRKE